jgi:sortase A
MPAASNFNNAMARTHRPLRISVILLFSMSLIALGLLRDVGLSSSAAPILQTSSDVPVLTTTTTAPPPPTTVAPVAADSPRLKSGAVAVPKNSYAPEPIVQIGQLEIPKIGLVTPIYHGITLRNIDNGPSHWPGTAMPGDVGNSVFAGHRVTHSHPFLNIDLLEAGDLAVFTVNGVKSTYQVTSHEIVKPNALWIADQTATPTATIFGCHPKHSASYRYVVHMALVQQ